VSHDHGRSHAVFAGRSSVIMVARDGPGAAR
jgi:hypothetical protein